MRPDCWIGVDLPYLKILTGGKIERIGTGSVGHIDRLTCILCTIAIRIREDRPAFQRGIVGIKPTIVIEIGVDRTGRRSTLKANARNRYLRTHHPMRLALYEFQVVEARLD